MSKDWSLCFFKNISGARRAYSEHVYQTQLTHTTYTTQHMLRALREKPAAGSSQIKNVYTSRIDLFTDDNDKRFLSVFTWQPLLGIAEIYLLYFFVWEHCIHQTVESD